MCLLHLSLPLRPEELERRGFHVGLERPAIQANCCWLLSYLHSSESTVEVEVEVEEGGLQKQWLPAEAARWFGERRREQWAAFINKSIRAAIVFL